MKKKAYQMPATKYIAVSEQALLEGTITEIDGNGPGYGGAGNGPAYAGEYNVWESDNDFNTSGEVKSDKTVWDY